MFKKISKVVTLVLISMIILVGCAGDGPNSKGKISFADPGWDSANFHNAVAGLIAETIYGYTWTEVPGGATVLHEGLINGEVDVHMEVWTDNIPSYLRDIQDDKLKEIGINFDDNNQGIYVPRYLIEGDVERGIEALAPDLKTVEDLKKYSHLFPDEESPDKGRIYGSIPGWEVDTIIYNKYLHYGLDEDYIYFSPGSDAALSATLTSAYDRGEPIAAYYWEPTWLMGKYDFVLLEDEPFDLDTYMSGKTELPSVKVTIATSNKFYNENPEFVEFLSKYETSSDLTSEALAYMQDTGANYNETAKWFLNKYDDLIDKWLKEEDAQKLRESINE